MNARPHIEPEAIGASMRDGRAYRPQTSPRTARELADDFPPRLYSIGPRALHFVEIGAKAVIVVGAIVSVLLVVTQ